jgi:Fic/DOC family
MMTHWSACLSPQFDPEVVRRVVHEVMAAATEADAVQALVEQQLADRIGPWAALFSWSTSEPGGGGPVQAWCCADDSLTGELDKDAETIVDAVADLADWLTGLAKIFTLLDIETAGLPEDRAVAHAAAALLGPVIERTTCSDAWYNTFAQVLTWWAEHRGAPTDTALKIAIRTVLRGRFHSWSEPEEAVRQETCAALGGAVNQWVSCQPQAVDGYAIWTAMRRQLTTIDEPLRYPPLGRDGHMLWIRSIEVARDSVRAQRMEHALLQLRSVVETQPLDLASMLAAQQIALPEQPGLRSTVAWAKAGREFYSVTNDLPGVFSGYLADAMSDQADVALRAVRLYLDICFLHPFKDGNARMARLALDAVLWRAGFRLRAVSALFSLERDPADERGAWRFMWNLNKCMEPR